jgi:hypothetical protein
MRELSLDELRYLAAEAPLPDKLVVDAASETVSRFRDAWGAAKSGRRARGGAGVDKRGKVAASQPETRRVGPRRTTSAHICSRTETDARS